MSNGDGTEAPEEEVVEVADDFATRNQHASELVEHSDILVDNSEDLMQAFSNFFDSDFEFNDLGKLWNNVNVVLKPEFDDIDDLADAANALVNLVENLDAETIELLREEGADDDLISLLKDLKLNHGYQLDREFNRLQKGRNWWSNIKTNTGFRSKRPAFEHELTIDYSETVVFNSDINTTLVLIDHFVRQLKSVPGLVGDDALLEIDKGQVDTIIERLEELNDEIEDYEEEIENISEESGDSENQED